MFEKGKGIYITREVQKIDKYLINVMLNQIFTLKVTKDYLQVFKLSKLKNYIQIVEHSQEVPEYHSVIYLPDIPVEALYEDKIYIIDNGKQIVIMLANEY